VVYYGRLAAAEDPLRLNIPFPFALFYFPFALVMDYTLAGHCDDSALKLL
jgi:hypothetical protein